MPPKKFRAKAPVSSATTTHSRAAPRQDAAEVIDQEVVKCFAKVHQSSSTHQAQRTALLALAEKDERNNSVEKVVNSICKVVLRVLPMEIRSEDAKRHHEFIGELCKDFTRKFNDDILPYTVSQEILKYQNAVSKEVRLSVCTLLDHFLYAFKQDVEDRDDFYETVVDALKLRVFDKHPLVREKAVHGLGVFQTARQECDVTQTFLAVLETDTSHAVRREALNALRFADDAVALQLYFPHIVRHLFDRAPLVQRTAWIRLSEIKFKHMIPLCKANHFNLVKTLAHGLQQEKVVSVKNAVLSAICKTWLPQAPANGNPVEFLEKALTTTMDPFADNSAEIVARHLLKFYKNGHSKKDYQSCFMLNHQRVNVANLLFWKALCQQQDEAEEEQGETEEAEEEKVILPDLSHFAQILQDARTLYLDTNAETKTITLANAEKEIEDVMRVLLSMFEVYQDAGYLLHINDQNRRDLITQMGFLLKVVPSGHPTLYVRDAILALRCLTDGAERELQSVVEKALQKLFQGLMLTRQTHQVDADERLTFEDAETYGSLDKTRRDRLKQLKVYRDRRRMPDPSEEENKLVEAVEWDSKFLERMVSIVHCFLSQGNRGDPMLSFCHHMIDLGRLQCDPYVQSRATYCLGIQCLMMPENVHTHVPLLLRDVTSCAGLEDPTEEQLLPAASLSVLFDLVAEYGFKFFSNPTTEEQKAAQEVMPVGSPKQADRHEKEAEVRMEDNTKVGGKWLFDKLHSFVYWQELPAQLHRIAILGFCKLLACNRICPEHKQIVIAQIFLQLFSARAVLMETNQAHIERLHQHGEFFLGSFAYSKPERQFAVAQGGILALRIALEKHQSSTTSSAVERIIHQLLHLTDAAYLQIVEEDANAQNLIKSTKDENQEDGNESVATSRSRGRSTSRPQGNDRLQRELARYSLQEYIANEFFVELTCLKEKPLLQKQLLDALSKKFRFYKQKDVPCANLMQSHAEMAIKAVHSSFTSALENIAENAVDMVSNRGAGATGKDISNTTLNTTADSTAVPRNSSMMELHELAELTFEQRLNVRNKEVEMFWQTVSAEELPDDGPLAQQRDSDSESEAED